MTKPRKLLSVLLSLVMLLSIIPAFTLPAFADTWDGTWDGSGFSNNHITSAKGLAQFINNAGTGTSYSGQTVYLDVDINLNNIDFGNISGGKNVYYSRDNYFQGTFDGQGHTIANFQMHNSDHRVALFRSARNATFKNVTFTNVFVDDNDNNNKRAGFAVVVGYGEGNMTFENVHISGGNVYGYNYVGGLIGEYGANDTLRFTNCSNSAKITADNDRAAGLVGHSKGSVVANGCSNTGEIYAGYSDAGGIAGWIEDDESSFVNCSNTGKVSTDACAGGIFGYFGSKSQDKKMTLTGCSNTGYIESRAKVGGGIAGMMDTDAEHSIENNINRGDVYGREDAGGIVGSNIGAGIWRNNTNSGNVSCTNDNASGICGDVEDDVQKFYNCYNNGNVTGKNSIGGVLGYGQNANHEFYDCGNSGTITSTSDAAGGIFGYGNESEPIIEQCWNIGAVNAYNDAGGILGRTYHHSYIRRCFNTGAIGTYNHNENGAHGGIAGQTSDKSGSSNDNPNMTDCFNWGPVSGGRDDGGLIGKIKDGRTPYYITNSYNAGDVSGTRPYAIISYGGNVGNNVYYNSNKSIGTAQGTAISDGDLRNSSGFSGNYCKNTWGVKIGNTTYYYPILPWYRNLFLFNLKFVDAPSGTNAYFDGNYGAGFYVPDASRTGYSSGDWYDENDQNRRMAKNALIWCGSTAPTDTMTVTQHFDDVTKINNETKFVLTWTKNQYYLDVNGYLDADSGAGGVGGYGTFDMYVNGNLVANDVDDFWQQIYYEDTYEIRDIKAAPGKVYIGLTEGSLSGTMGTSQINIRMQFKSQYTVTFKDVLGNTLKTQTVNYGDAATAPANVPEYLQITNNDSDHYHYLGTWDTAFNNVTSDLTVHANYELLSHVYGAYASDGADTHSRVCADCGYVQAVAHVFTQQTANAETLASAATCINQASYYFTCSVCGMIEHNEAHTFFSGDRADHTWVWDTDSDPTCGAPGKKHQRCSVCGTTQNMNTEIPATGDHTLNATAANAATCTEPGNSAYWTCSVCGKYFSDAEGNTEIAENSWILQANGHEYSEWTEEQAATCSAAGHVGYYYCGVCQKYFDAEYNVIDDIVIGIDSDAHSYGAWTKLNDEKHQRVCAYNPTHVETEDHGWNETGSSAATCIAYGSVSYACSVCGAVKTETGSVYGGHTFTAQRAEEDYLAVSATCIAPARYYYACTLCGLSENDPAHTFENGEPDTVNGHQLTHHDAQAPTCTAVGWDAYDTCALCTYTTYAEIPATGHTYVEPAEEDWIWTRSGDIFTATVTVSCAHNDDTQVLTASVLLTENVPATADADGYKIFTATVTVGEGANQQTFIAENTLTYYYVSVVPGTGVTVSGAETGSYEAGTALTVSAAADTGYDQSAPVLYVNGAEAENPADITVNAAVAITTNDLPLNTYTLTWADQWGNVITTATGSYGWATIMPIDDPADVRIEDQVWTFDHWDNGKTAGQSINFSSAAQTPVITAIYTLTDQVAKYTVTFLNDDNYTVLSTAEYEYNEAVVIPGTPVSTNRTKELDYTFLGWTPEVAGTVTADATYVATYETEAHSRIYPVQWVYDDGTLHVVKEENLPYDTVFTAADLPGDVYVRDDGVTHYTYSWADWAETALSYHIGYGTTAVSIYADASPDRHVGTPAYEWIGSDADGYTKCIATMTCADCGEELRVEYTLDEDDVYTHTGEHCEDQSYTTYRAWIAGSGVNSYFENKTKTVYGGYGDHFYPSSTAEAVWNTEDVNNVTCKMTQTCYYCGHVEEDPGTVSVYEQTPATCASPEKTVFVAEFDRWTDQYSEEIETAPIDANAHKYDGWGVRPDDARSTRPVYDAGTDTWSKGTLVIPCANTYTLDYNYDPETGAMTVSFNYTVDDYAAHDKILTDLDRADYEAFDEALEKFRSISALDIADDTVIYAETYGDETYETTFGEFKAMFFDRMLETAEQFPQNLVTIPAGAEGHEFDEQPRVDDMTEQMQMTLDLFFNEDGTPKEELLNHYTVTFTLKDGTVTSYNKIRGAVVEIPAAPAEADGYAFLGWTLDGSSIALAADAAEYTVTGDAAFTAKYADTPAVCTVTFLNADDTLLASVTVAYGAELSEADIPAVPAKEADAEYHYIGAWDNTVVTAVTADATYKAVYTPEAHTGGTATCEAQAECTVCGALYGELAAHTYGEWVPAQAATCSAAGHVGYYYCGICEKYFDAEYNVIDDIEIAIDPDAHSWTWVTDLDPTCGEPGKKHQECTLCGDTQAEDTAIDPTGEHTAAEAVIENNVAPTCTEGGSYDSVVYCAVCGTELSKTHVTVGALGHDFGDWTETTAPTCTEAGEEQRTCSRCPETETRSVTALGHDFGEWTETTAPTCTETGEEQRTCSRCPETETRSVTALGHDFGEWTETLAPTCTEAGEEQRTCSRCPETETKAVPALGHSWGAWVTVTEPTVEADGLRRRECTRCDAVQEETLAYTGEANRQIQFVVSGNMHYVVQLRDANYEIYSRTTPAIYWYDNVPLSFLVVTHSGWAADGVIVSLNGNELAPNADGSYTIPGGTGFAKINCYAASSATPATPSGESGGNGVCGYCGKVHPGNLWGRLVAFFHLIFLFFRNLFKK